MKLAKREKLFVVAAGVILGAFLILQMIVIPFFEKKNQMEKETRTLERYIEDLAKMNPVGQGISEISGGLEKALASRKVDLSTFIYREAESIGLKMNNIPKMNPSEGKIQGGYQEDLLEVQLNEVTHLQLTQFLLGVEKPEKYIFINRISLKKNKKEEGYIDATISVMSYKKANPGQ